MRRPISRRFSRSLADTTNKAVASALGVSIPYASGIRAGRRIPHPLHWQALAQLVGMSAVHRNNLRSCLAHPKEKGIHVGNRELVSIIAAVIYATRTHDQRLRDIGTDVSLHSTTRREIADAVRIANAIVEDASHA